MPAGNVREERPQGRIAGERNARALLRQDGDVAGRHDSVAKPLLGDDENAPAVNFTAWTQQEPARGGA